MHTSVEYHIISKPEYEEIVSLSNMFYVQKSLFEKRFSKYDAKYDSKYICIHYDRIV